MDAIDEACAHVFTAGFGGRECEQGENESEWERNGRMRKRSSEVMPGEVQKSRAVPFGYERQHRKAERETVIASIRRLCGSMNYITASTP